jgi:hypothetical protein
MNIIESIVPISIENLKSYFSNKDQTFLIDYDKSEIKGEKFLIYLSNLDLPCNVKLDISKEEHRELLKYYFTTKNIVNIPSLEITALHVCLDYKYNLESLSRQFISENEDLVKSWLSVLESLTLYNFYCINSKKFKEHVTSHEHADCSNIGLNFVNLIKYDDFQYVVTNIKKENLKYYESFFNDYMFKGNNLYRYWATEENNLFLITWKIIHDVENQKEKENVASV